MSVGLTMHGHKAMKKLKRRKERRLAKKKPEVQPKYKKFWGYLT